MAPHLLSPSTPLVIGHRGAGRSATENTSASFHEARRLGADLVELDVVATADGKLALAHDIFVDGEPVWLQQAADLPFEMLGPESVPEGMGIALEVKLVPTDVEGRGTLRALLPALEKLAAGHPLLCLAFDPVAAARLSQLGIPTGWIVKQGLPTVEAAITTRWLGVDVVMLHGPTTDVTHPGWEHARALLRGGPAIWEWDAEPGTASLHRDHGVVGFCGDDVAGLSQVLHCSPRG